MQDLERLDHVLTRLVRLARLPRVHERLVERAGVAIEPSAYAILSRIEEHEPVRLTDLAQELSVEISTASRQVSQLERSDLLDRRPDPTDGRSSMLTLSPDGRRVLARVREARTSALHEILSGWSRDDRVRLAGLLDRLVADITAFVEEV